MVKMTVTYSGDLGCAAEHGPSGARVGTDAPKDNNGKGESFSPTDLVATALGSCMLTIMGITARQLQVDMKGAVASVEKEMVADPHRRIGRLGVRITMPEGIPAEVHDKLEQAALTCPVHKSLHSDTEIPVEFVWQ